MNWLEQRPPAVILDAVTQRIPDAADKRWWRTPNPSSLSRLNRGQQRESVQLVASVRLEPVWVSGDEYRVLVAMVGELTGNDMIWFPAGHFEKPPIVVAALAAEEFGLKEVALNGQAWRRIPTPDRDVPVWQYWDVSDEAAPVANATVVTLRRSVWARYVGDSLRPVWLGMANGIIYWATRNDAGDA